MNATHGLVSVRFVDDVDRALLLRVGGPHPQTVVLQSDGKGTSNAYFALCTSGTYSLSLRVVVVDPWGVHDPAPSDSTGFWRKCGVAHFENSTIVASHTFEHPPATFSDGFRAAAAVQDCSPCLWSWHPPLSPAAQAMHSAMANVTTRQPYVDEANARGRARLEAVRAGALRYGEAPGDSGSARRRAAGGGGDHGGVGGAAGPYGSTATGNATDDGGGPVG
eukprot:1512762-Prymnesium_polylepis.2